MCVDPSIFADYHYYGSWEWGDLSYDYGALPTATIVNSNVIDITVMGGIGAGEPSQVSFSDAAEQAVVLVLTFSQ